MAIVTDQLVPPQLFDLPCKVGSEFFAPQCQLLAKIFRHNIMSVRENKLLHPFDLELMKCVWNQHLPYNLPCFLLTSFMHCYQHNCLGYGLVLTSIFQHLGINVLNHQTQYVKSSKIVSHLNLPPKQLIIFKPETTELPEPHQNLLSQIDYLISLTQLSLQNQNNLLCRIESLQFYVHW